VLLAPCASADMDAAATDLPIYCHQQMTVDSLNILLPPSVLLLVVVPAGWSFCSEYSFVSVVALLTAHCAVSPMLTPPALTVILPAHIVTIAPHLLLF